MQGTDLDWVVLKELEFEAIVGILPFEQAHAQPLQLELKLGVNLDEAGASGDLSKSINYAAVANQVRFVAQQGRWRLLESLGTAICRLLLAPPAEQEQRAAVARVEVRIAKPTILEGLAVPSVVLRRKADWCRMPRFKQPSRATVDTLEATPISGAYRVHVAGGTSWEPPAGVALMGVSGRLRHGALVLDPGTEMARMCGPLENRSAREATVLAVGTPFR